MTPNFEQAVEIIKTLPISELKELSKLIDEKTKLAEPKTNKDEIKKLQQSMKWLDENRQKYLGQWVCLDGNNLIGHGTDAVKLYKQAKEKGVKVPFVEHIVEDEAYGGGIEACQ